MNYYVYWYRLPEHTDIKSEGYVGITHNLDERNAGHKHAAFTAKKPYRFPCAIRKHKDKIIRDVVCITSKEHALYLETVLRPSPNIGWNSAIGGGDAPSPLGRKHSEYTKEKIGAAHKGKPKGPSPFKGITDRYSAEQKALIGSYHKGKEISEQHRLAISQKMSGSNSPKAKEIHLVHRDNPSDVKVFACIKEAADTLDLPYQALRSQYQYTTKQGKTSEPNRQGWVCLFGEDINHPQQAVDRAVKARSKRSKLTPKASGSSNHKSRNIALENTEGVVQTFESINLAAKAIGMSEATLRYHAQQTSKKQKDANFTKQGWRVKYIKV